MSGQYTGLKPRVRPSMLGKVKIPQSAAETQDWFGWNLCKYDLVDLADFGSIGKQQRLKV